MDINVNYQSLNISSIVDIGNELKAATTTLHVPSPPRNTHAMKTRAKSGILKPKAFHITFALLTPHHTQTPLSISNGELRCVRNSMLFKHKVPGPWYLDFHL